MKTAIGLATLGLLVALICSVLVITRGVNRNLSDVHATVDELHATLGAAHETLTTLNGMADREKRSFEDTGKDAAHTAEDLRRLVAHTDRILTRINSTTLDGLDREIRANGDQLQATLADLGAATVQIGEAGTKIGGTADSVTRATDSLNLRIADPRIDQMLVSFNLAAAEMATSSHNLSIATANGTSILGHGDHIMAYYDKKLTTPLGFWKTLISTGLDFGSKTANIAAAVK